MKADNVRTPTAVTAPAAAKNLRTRGLATIRLRPATATPAISANKAVLVCVRSRMARPGPPQEACFLPLRLPRSQSTTTSPITTAA